MRLFFALLAEEAAQARFAQLAAQLPLEPPAYVVPPANLHLTLWFLGAVAPDAVPALQRAARSAPLARCRFEFDELVWWPKSRVVATVARTTPSSIESFQHTLRAALGEGVWPASETLPLRPHVTLARRVRHAPLLPQMCTFVWRPMRYGLLSSDGASPPRYTVVDSWALLDE